MNPPAGSRDRSEALIAQADRYGARNYEPLPVVVSRAEGAWVWDPEGNRYLDMLSAYSALNLGHRHPAIVRALVDQANRVTLVSRAFHHDLLGPFYEKLARITGKQAILPMNTGAEAVETAIKAARRWAYLRKGVPADQAEIIVCEGNFHGRTTTITSFSSNAAYREGFGPFGPGFRLVPFGDSEALNEAITPNTAAFLVEPIQGEAGIVIPPDGYLREAKRLCEERNVLFVADEIQTGLGRTGQWFACDREGIVPDAYLIGKALGGGAFPVSAVAADRELLDVFDAGSHGSTFGGNPLACAVAVAALEVLETERLPERSRTSGDYLLEGLWALQSPIVRDVRGAGLFAGIELAVPARPYCERLMRLGVLCKETHGNTIRLSPPLTIRQDELDFAIAAIAAALPSQA